MNDEKLFARLSRRNTIEIYDKTNFTEPKYKIVATPE
jgi:hypothetical protein